MLDYLMQTLLTEIENFKTWANSKKIRKDRSYGWECCYLEWDAIYGAFKNMLNQPLAHEQVPELLYIIARDEESEYIMEELAHHKEWFELLCSYAINSCETNARWLFAKHLAEFSDEEFAKDLIISFLNDDDEYTTRMAIVSLAKISPELVEEYAEKAWCTNHEYQRIAAIHALDAVNSPLLQSYIEKAKTDGRKYVVENANRATDLYKSLFEACEKAFLDLFENDETYYYCSIVVFNEPLSPVISAWSYEALERADDSDMKWSLADSPYYAHGYDDYFSKVTDIVQEYEVDDIKEIADLVLQELYSSMIFHKNQSRSSVAVTIETLPPHYDDTIRSIKINVPDNKTFNEWLDNAEMEIVANSLQSILARYERQDISYDLPNDIMEILQYLQNVMLSDDIVFGYGAESSISEHNECDNYILIATSGTGDEWIYRKSDGVVCFLDHDKLEEDDAITPLNLTLEQFVVLADLMYQFDVLYDAHESVIESLKGEMSKLSCDLPDIYPYDL